MNDVIAFIERAMKENLKIRTTARDWDSLTELVITIYNKEEENTITIQCLSSSKDNDYFIELTSEYLDWVKIEVSEMDIAQFKVEILKAQEYSRNSVIKCFNSFFEKESKPTDINDLDYEED